MAIHYHYEKQPKSGKAKQLWDWWIGMGFKPPRLTVNNPGHWQRSQGTPGYCLNPDSSDNLGTTLDFTCDADEIAEVIKGTREQVEKAANTYHARRFNVVYMPVQN